jgi:hypothetical protein
MLHHSFELQIYLSKYKGSNTLQITVINEYPPSAVKAPFQYLLDKQTEMSSLEHVLQVREYEPHPQARSESTCPMAKAPLQYS